MHNNPYVYVFRHLNYSTCFSISFINHLVLSDDVYHLNSATPIQLESPYPYGDPSIQIQCKRHHMKQDSQSSTTDSERFKFHFIQKTLRNFSLFAKITEIVFKPRSIGLENTYRSLPI